MSGGNLLVSLREIKLFENNKTEVADGRKYRLEPSTDEKQRPSWRQNRIMKLYIGNKIMDINLDSLLLDSDSHAESDCIYFWRCRQATERKNMAVLA